MVTARVLIVGCLFFGLCYQVLVPLILLSDRGWNLTIDQIAIPYSVAAVIAIALLQVGLLRIWKLLKIAAVGEIFTTQAVAVWRQATRWFTAAGVVGVLIFGHWIFIIGVIDEVGIALFPVSIGLVLGSLSVSHIGASLLEAAIAQKNELAEVI